MYLPGFEPSSSVVLGEYVTHLATVADECSQIAQTLQGLVTSIKECMLLAVRVCLCAKQLKKLWMEVASFRKC